MFRPYIQSKLAVKSAYSIGAGKTRKESTVSTFSQKVTSPTAIAKYSKPIGSNYKAEQNGYRAEHNGYKTEENGFKLDKSEINSASTLKLR